MQQTGCWERRLQYPTFLKDLHSYLPKVYSGNSSGNAALDPGMSTHTVLTDFYSKVDGSRMHDGTSCTKRHSLKTRLHARTKQAFVAFTTPRNHPARKILPKHAPYVISSYHHRTSTVSQCHRTGAVAGPLNLALNTACSWLQSRERWSPIHARAAAASHASGTGALPISEAHIWGSSQYAHEDRFVARTVLT